MALVLAAASGVCSCMHVSLIAPSDPLNAPPFAVVSDAGVAKGLSLPTAPGIVVVSYLGGMRKYQGAYDNEALYNWTIDNRMAQVRAWSLHTI